MRTKEWVVHTLERRRSRVEYIVSAVSREEAESSVQKNGMGAIMSENVTSSDPIDIQILSCEENR